MLAHIKFTGERSPSRIRFPKKWKWKSHHIKFQEFGVSRWKHSWTFNCRSVPTQIDKYPYTLPPRFCKARFGTPILCVVLPRQLSDTRIPPTVSRSQINLFFSPIFIFTIKIMLKLKTSDNRNASSFSIPARVTNHDLFENLFQLWHQRHDIVTRTCRHAITLSTGATLSVWWSYCTGRKQRIGSPRQRNMDTCWHTAVWAWLLLLWRTTGRALGENYFPWRNIIEVGCLNIVQGNLKLLPAWPARMNEAKTLRMRELWGKWMKVWVI